MRTFAAAAIVACLASCNADLQVPSGTAVTCSTTQPHCPDGYACDATLGLCLPTDLVVPSVTVNEAIVHGGALWVDDVAITLSLALPVGAAAPATVTIGGDVATPGSLPYATTLPVTLTSGDGDKTLQLQFADDTGNPAPGAPLTLRLDTAAPSNAVVVSAPQILIGEVALPDVYVNADNLSVPFASNPPAQPDDFDSYVFSTDGGVSWNPTPAPLVLSPLAQDKDTAVLISERNIFGKMTPAAQQGRVTIHEDSQPPSAPQALVQQVTANLSSEAGVLVVPSIDPGGGPVQYEVIGGSYTEYTPVGARPYIHFSGVPAGQLSVYLVHAVDRAGNTSPTLDVPVGDDSLATTGIERNDPQHYDFWGGNGMGAYGVKVDTSNSLEICPLNGTGNSQCGAYDLPTASASQLVRNPSVFARNAVFEDTTTASKPSIAFIDLGPDGLLDFGGVGDDAALADLDFGHCPVAGPGGIVYGKWISTNNYEPAFYRYGADGVGHTSDSGEGIIVLSSTARMMTGNPCWPQFNGRQVLWIATTADWYLYDLGLDRVPGTGDDVTEKLIVPSSDDLGDRNNVALGDSGYAVYPDRARTVQWFGFGPDGAYGTTDDPAPTDHRLDGLPSQNDQDIVVMPSARDGKLIGLLDGNPVLYDLGAHRAVVLDSTLVSGGTFKNISLGAASIFGSLELDTRTTTKLDIPAYFLFSGDPMSYRFDSGAVRDVPSGSWAGNFALLVMESLDARLFINLTAGGSYLLNEEPPANDAIDISPEGLMVWIDSASNDLMLFGAGPDQLPGSADDLGPVQLPAGLYAQWPRVASGRVVWADLSADADHSWTGADLVSSLVVLDLGADGWYGSDDIPVALTDAGTKAVTPALVGDRLAYLDFTNDPSGACETSGRSGIVHSQCLSQVVAIDLTTNVEATLSSTLIYHDSLRVDATGRAVWAQDSTSSGSDIHVWDSAERTVATALSATSLPQLDGSHLTYFTSQGPVVLDAGDDGLLGTTDDVSVRSGFGAAGPPIIPVTGLGVQEPPYWRWLGPEGLLLGAGVLPLSDDTQHYAGSTALPIPDGGTVADGITITAAPDDLVEDMTIAVSIMHTSPADLTLRLTSPSGDAVTLLQHASVDVSNLSFDLTTLPALLNHWGEPIAGVWLLTIDDVANGTGGTLASWSIAHRP